MTVYMIIITASTNTAHLPKNMLRRRMIHGEVLFAIYSTYIPNKT